MLFLVTDAERRPNMLEDKKDETYHMKWGRYCVGQANTQKHIDFVDKIRQNKNFYKSKQWIFDEDLEAFLKDDTGQSRNRLKVIKNIIRPMVENYRGNAVRMKINARAKSVSPQVISRREQKLQEMFLYTDIANQEGNPYGEELKKRLPIGNSKEETESTFDNLWVDPYTQTINDLLEYVADRNRLEAKQARIAEEMALCGMAVMKQYEYGGHQNFNFVEPENFFWDRSGKEYDLSDSEFMGECFYLTESEIFEEFQSMNEYQRNAIQTYAQQFHRISFNHGTSNNRNTQNKYETGGRIPVFYVYWRDTEKYEYGYVKDQFGYPYLTKINYTEEGEDAPKYTDADLIEVDTVRSRRVLGGKKKKTIYVDILRYVQFIPREVLAVVTPSDENDKISDIIGSYGIAPYQETESLDVSNVKFPYKCFCWGYIDGEVLSPVDDAISPQRMINRILSVAENQINNSRGAGTFYDKSMIDPNGGEEELLRNLNQSKPVGLNVKGRGIQNAVSQYDSTVKQGTMVLYNIVDVLSNHVQQMTGINEALRGESTGSDQLVGVTELMIQRGSLMQEPFYNAVTEIFLQCYQSIATVGKRIYADNERELTMAVGDAGAKIIKITKDMKTEDFRVFVKRDNPQDMLVRAGDQMLTMFLQMQLIDKDMFANLYGRSTPDQITAALRRKAKDDREVAKMDQKNQEQQAQALQQQIEQQGQEQRRMMDEAVARDDIKDLQDKKHEQNMAYIKNLGSLAKTSPKAQQQIIDQTKNLQSNII